MLFCVGCDSIIPKPQIEQTKSDANAIVAIAVSIVDNTVETVYVVGTCPECKGSGRTGDNLGACGPCAGDGQISQKDADVANGVTTDEEPSANVVAFAKPIEYVTLTEARERSIKEKLPVWIHFSKNKECQVCAMLKKVVFPDTKVIEASKQFICVQIDCDAVPAKLLTDFRIDRREGLPQDLFLLPEWKQIAKPFKSRPPITAQGYVTHLNNWAAYLTKR